MSNTQDTTISGPDGWFVVWTGPRAEKKVAERIAAMKLESWLPVLTERRRWSDRWREVTTPLFPGYLFARAGSANLPPILRTPGVLTVVKTADKPAVLTHGFVASLRSTLELNGVVAERVDEPADYAIDEEVIVQDGPLSGCRGVVRQVRGNQQIVVWIPELGRGVAFTMSAVIVARAEPSRRVRYSRV